LNKENAMPQHDDGQDDVSALTFFSTSQSGDDGGAGSSVAALREQISAESQDSTSDVDAIRSATDVTSDEEALLDPEDYLAKVTNLPGTVSVTALLDGSPHQIDVSQKATGMSESALAEEILVIADLARQKGLAKQQVFMTHAVASLDLEDAGAAQTLLTDFMDLPTPEQAEAAKTEVFATLYAADPD
jgi:hypothetical protein